MSRMIRLTAAPSTITRLSSVKIECIFVFYSYVLCLSISVTGTLMKELFRRISTRVSAWTGTAGAFMLALTVVIVWAITGPLFHFSNTWQLVINTGTTIV